MFKIALIFGLLAGVQLSPVDETANDVDSRISGGASVTIDRTPWQLSLRTRYARPARHICGASLITPNRALTARRCFTVNVRPELFFVVAGTSTLHEESVFQTPLERFIFQQHAGAAIRAEIAVLWLLHPAPLRTTIRPIALPAQNAAVPYGTQAIISGWGRTSYHPGENTFANNLTYTLVPIVTNAQCNVIYGGQITENMLCAGGVAERGTCNGDYGGALVVNGVQVGVASWGFCGAANRPDVFGRIAPVVNWIRSVI